MSRDAFPSRELSLSGSSRCSSQPPSTRRVGSGKHLVLILGRVGGHQLLEGGQLKDTKVVITAPTRHAKRYRDLDGLFPRYLILHDLLELLLELLALLRLLLLLLALLRLLLLALLLLLLALLLLMLLMLLELLELLLELQEPLLLV